MHAIIAAMGVRPLMFSGTFTTTGSGTPITSATRTVQGGGTLLFVNVVEVADLEYSKNAGAWTDITEGLTLAVVNGDTLAVRESFAAPDSATFDLKNNATGALIESVTLTRT